MPNPIPPESLLTTSLRQSPRAAAITRVMAAALHASDPFLAVKRHLNHRGNLLFAGEKPYDLEKYNHIYVIGGGKAGFPMATATAQTLGEHLSHGIVVVKEGYLPRENIPYPIKFFEACHPLPDQRNLRATNKILKLLENAQENDLFICLISGGGSALLTAPVQGISLQDIRSLTTTLLACGAPIQSINILRKHLDSVKGGRISHAAWPASVISLILSDVIGDPLDAIASGPTVPDPSTLEDALKILDTYHLSDPVVEKIKDHLISGLVSSQAETPKPGDLLFERTNNILIGSNHLAIKAAQAQAEAEGYQTNILTDSLQGEARLVGEAISRRIRQAIQTRKKGSQSMCWIAGGETTVTLANKAGLGGRNQELALAAASGLAGLQDVFLITLATDGNDGPTDAAGAVVTGDTLRHAQLLAIDVDAALQNHNSYPVLARLGDLIKTGPTLTNVNDLLFVFQS